MAYGILVQSALLGQDDVLAQLVQAYQCFNLPTTLAALEVDINNRAELDRGHCPYPAPGRVDSLFTGDVNP
ncbi:oxidoreductase [Klebsiella pneumoniae]|uniref:Oxidoreductase n=1 Tax=Klebsiella pneumoniae TaxID=573 RepID=A0A377WF14_KLEPN|nr:oxidoreductase [Klebsiella pneumoniae]